jgi:hypothetical protein
MSFRTILITCLLMSAAVSAQGAPGQPNFMPALYGDGELWGTKFTALLPPPNAHNGQSFDALYVIRNHPDGQLPVSEAAPGNPNYNGGRWDVHQVFWTEQGFIDHMGNVPVLMSYEDILLHESLGHLYIMEGTFEGGPPQYFQCPMLPVK